MFGMDGEWFSGFETFMMYVKFNNWWGLQHIDILLFDYPRDVYIYIYIS